PFRITMSRNGDVGGAVRAALLAGHVSGLVGGCRPVDATSGPAGCCTAAPVAHRRATLTERPIRRRQPARAKSRGGRHYLHSCPVHRGRTGRRRTGTAAASLPTPGKVE